MPYRNRVFVSFDGDNDIHYYRLMRAWKQSDHTHFAFHDAHDINVARDTSTEATIKRRLRERLANTKIVVSLIGEHTRYHYKFVRWELEQAIIRELPIVGVNLNGRRSQDTTRCPPIIREELAVHISFNAAILQYALEDWPAKHANFKREGKTGPYYYTNQVYNSLEL